MDAPPVARSRSATGRRRRWRGRSADGGRLMTAIRTGPPRARAVAQLARRRGDGAAGDRRRAPPLPGARLIVAARRVGRRSVPPGARRRRGRRRSSGTGTAAAPRAARRRRSAAAVGADVGDPAAELVRVGVAGQTRRRFAERWGYATDLRRPLLTRAVAAADAAACTRRRTTSTWSARSASRPARSSRRSTCPTPAIDGGADAADDARLGRRRGRWSSSRPARRTARPSAGCRRTSPTLVDEARARPAAHVRAGRQRRRSRDHDVDASALVAGDAARARHRPGRRHDAARRWPACSRLAQACVSNDSGAMHLAAAVGRAGRRALRADARARDRAAAARRRPGRGADQPGLVPPLYAARVSDRSSLHDGPVAGSRAGDVRELMARSSR